MNLQTNSQNGQIINNLLLVGTQDFMMHELLSTFGVHQTKNYGIQNSRNVIFIKINV